MYNVGEHFAFSKGFVLKKYSEEHCFEGYKHETRSIKFGIQHSFPSFSDWENEKKNCLVSQARLAPVW